MIKRFTTITRIFLFLLLPIMVSAQGLKIGYATPEKIVDQMAEFKKVQADLQKMIQDKEANLVGKRDSLGIAFKRYQEISSTLSPQKNDEEQAKLQALNDELQELSSQIRIEVQRKQSELLQPLYAKVQEAINGVAKEMKLDFVFNRNTAQGDAIILFASDSEKDKLDITDKVIAKLTKK